VGGITSSILPGTRVRAGPRKLPGAVGLVPIHLVKKAERKKVPDPDKLYIDIGARDRENALSLVSPGDYVSFASEPAFFGEGYLRARRSTTGWAAPFLWSWMKTRVRRDVLVCR
jgi:endoglucanase